MNPWTFAATCLLLTSGCAGLRAPAQLDLNRVELVTSGSAPAVGIDGPSGKGSGAMTGAAAGGGVGLGVGFLAAMSCVAAGPLALICVAGVISTSTAVGAVGGAAYGAAKANSAEAVEAKRKLLVETLSAKDHQQQLAAALRDRAKSRFGLLPALRGDAKGREPWQLELALTDVFAEKNAEGLPFALRVQGTLKLRRLGDPDLVYEATHVATGTVRNTTEGWSAQGAEALHAGVQECIHLLADRMLDDLMRAQAKPRTSAMVHRIPQARSDGGVQFRVVGVPLGRASGPPAPRA